MSWSSGENDGKVQKYNKNQLKGMVVKSHLDVSEVDGRILPLTSESLSRRRNPIFGSNNGG